MQTTTFHHESLELTIAHTSVVNIALQRNGIPVIASINIRNQGPHALEDIGISIASASIQRANALGGYQTETLWTQRLSELDSGESWESQDVEIRIPDNVFADLEERTNIDLKLTVTRAGDALCHFTLPLQCLAYNEWQGGDVAPQTLAAFVLPNHPAMSAVLDRARNILQRWTGDSSLAGYQQGHSTRVQDITASIFTAIQEMGISYINPPASFEASGQKIRTPEMVINQRMATCLDITLLCAAALEATQLHPVVIVIEGHSFCGVWCHEDTPVTAVCTDGTQIRKSAKLSDLLLFDPTLAVSSPDARFTDATRQAARNLAHLDNFRFAVDIRAARAHAVRPLPARILGDDGRTRILDQHKREHTSNVQFVSEPDPRPELEAREKQHAANVNRHKSARNDHDARERLERWQSRLLDLSLRNRLLNFKHTKSTALLMFKDIAALEDALATQKPFTLSPKPDLLGRVEGQNVINEDIYESHDDLVPYLQDALQRRHIHSAYPSGDHASRLKKIYRDARQSLQETGVNQLHIAMGIVRWFEPDKPLVPRLAPLILLPAQLRRKAAKSTYTLSLSDDESRINLSLLERLRRDYGIDMPELSELLPRDGSGLDIELIMRQFRKAIAKLDGWALYESSFLGVLSFGNFMMWHDLRQNEQHLFHHPLTGRLLNPSGEPHTPDSPNTDNTPSGDTNTPGDGTPNTGDSHDEAVVQALCVLDADATQLDAVRASINGESFVLQGPPGTGKSQTIANIIAQNLARGKRVLFVAEKRAALDVVYRRLCNVGLEHFCLPLHSKDANKKMIARRLGTTLKQREIRQQRDDWDVHAKILKSRNAALSAYTHTLHRPRNLGMSLFEAVNRLTELQNAHKIACEPARSTDAFSEDAFGQAMDAVRDYADACANVMPIATHPLHAIRTSVIDPDTRNAVIHALGALQNASKDTRNTLADLPDDVPAPHNDGIKSLEAHGELLSSLTHRPPGARALCESDNWDILAPRLNSALARGRAYQQSRDHMLSLYSADFLSADLVAYREKLIQWKDAFFLFAFMMLWSLRRSITRSRNDRKLPDNQTLTSDVDAAIALHQQRHELDTTAVPEFLQGTLWERSSTNWEQLDDAISWVRSYRGQLQNAHDPQPWMKLARSEYLPWSATSGQLASYLDAVRDLRNAWSHLHAHVEIDLQNQSAAKNEWLEHLHTQVGNWLHAQDSFRVWSLYLEARERVVNAGLDALVEALEEEHIMPDALEDTAERSMLTWWTERAFASEPQLLRFNDDVHTRHIEEFREWGRQTQTLARKETQTRLAQNVPDTQNASRNSEIAILLREVQKSRKHLPTRELFQRIPNLLPTLAPCMLMSPISVAQHLSNSTLDFDIVVFDEASQIPPWSAVGSIARAKQCIVVGDSKQLPPTSFFDKAGDSDEDANIEDLESVLDEFIATGLPTRSIRWHYRSRDESLIAFSNHHYYGDNLMTFPSAMGDPGTLGVSHHSVPDGTYDKGSSRTNRKEAEAIVEDILRRLSDPDQKYRSIGVVTFSVAQQTLIEDLLDTARSQNPSIEPYFTDAVAEPVFVKNLENVQGDERDIILFSICYAPDANGELSMNFGPLNKKGGERRLNVAITRAREQLVVFSTLRPEDIDLSRTKATAVAQLKAFLKYAQIGAPAIASATSKEAEHVHAISGRIKDYLESQAHIVHANIGQSDYRINIGIRHPQNQQYVMLGVELDGPDYQRTTPHDRTNTRPAVLSRLGWNLHRIWTPAWWYQQDQQLEKIGETVQTLISQAPPTLRATTNRIQQNHSDDTAQHDGDTHHDDAAAEDIRTAPHRSIASAPPTIRTAPAARMESEQETQTTQQWANQLLQHTDVDYATLPNATTYRRAELPENAYAPEQFETNDNLVNIAHSLQQIVDIEAPVHFDDAARRVAQHWGYGRLSKRIKNRILRSAQLFASMAGIVIRNDFMWSTQVRASDYKAFRPAREGDPDRREFTHIAPEEIANAAYAILEADLSLPVDDLHFQLAKAFGYSARGRTIREGSDAAIQVLVEQQRATLHDGIVSYVAAAP